MDSIDYWLKIVIIIWGFPFCFATLLPSRKVVDRTIGCNLIRKYRSRPIKEDIECRGCRQVVTAPKRKNNFLHSSRCSTFDRMNSTRLDEKSDEWTGNRKAKVCLARSPSSQSAFAFLEYLGSVSRWSPIHACWWWNCKGKGKMQVNR